MFYIDKLATLHKNYKHKTLNRLNNVFVFEEVYGNVIGINEKIYDSVEEESIVGKNITVGFLLLERHGFNLENALSLMLRDALHFNLVQFKSKDFYTLFNKMVIGQIDFLAVSFPTEEAPLLATTAMMKYELFMRQPYTKFSSTFFIRVFDVSVWYSIIGIIIVSCLVFGLYKLTINKFNFNIVETIYFSLGMAEVRNRCHMSVSLRVACIVISVFMFLVMGAFSTFLTTEITVRDINLPFHTVDEIRHQSEYGYCVPNESYVFFDEVERGYSKLLNRGNCPQHHVLDYRFVESICNLENTVYLAVTGFVYIEMAEEYNGHPTCDIYVFKDIYDPVMNYRTLTSKRNFKYKRQVERVITQLRTSGILEFLYRKTLGIDRLQLTNNEPDDLIAVQYDHVKLIFETYLGFIVISIVILIIEVLVSTSSSD